MSKTETKTEKYLPIIFDVLVKLTIFAFLSGLTLILLGAILPPEHFDPAYVELGSNITKAGVISAIIAMAVSVLRLRIIIKNK